MLSEREKQTFREIEQHILRDDPRFGAVVRRLLSGRADRWVGRLYDVIIVVAVLSAVLCLVLSSAGAAVVAVLLAAALFYCRPRRWPSRSGRWGRCIAEWLRPGR
jgi:Flp pilus assembly protein TadB